MTLPNFDVPFNLCEQSLTTLVEELIEVSHNIYTFLLKEALCSEPISLVCGGQSPAYFALAILNLPIYNPKLVEVVVLPHSKGGQKGNLFNDIKAYLLQLKECNIILRNTVYILDTVHSGVGITSLEKMLMLSSPQSKFKMLSLNHPSSPPGIPVYKAFKALCVTRLSDIFPRIVQHYLPSEFHKTPMLPYLINLENNRYADFIKTSASVYRAIKMSINDS